MVVGGVCRKDEPLLTIVSGDVEQAEEGLMVSNNSSKEALRHRL